MGTAEHRPLRIVYSRAASNQLREIWDWNAQHYGIEHADNYKSYLTESCRALLADPELGKPVGDPFPKLRRLLIRRRSSGHGHIAIYRISAQQIDILYVFHSAQDWQSKIDDPE